MNGSGAARAGTPVRACDVLVVGGGSAGLFLGALLAQRGVDVVVLERRAEPSAHSRAIGLHPPALAALQELGMSEAALARGTPIERGVGRSRGHLLGHLAFDRVRTDFPFVLTLPQHRTEALLALRLEELAPGALHRGWEVRDVHEENGAVHVTAERCATPDANLAAGTGVVAGWRARAVVGADGARSTVRARAGIGTRLVSYPDTYLMGDFADATDDGGTAVIHLDPGGVVESFPLPGRVRRWVVHTGSALAAPCPEDLAAIVGHRTGAELRAASSTMVSAFTVRRQLARRMVAGRQVLIGDAAHEISPIGGQGMTLGWLDALALAPLLAQLVADDVPRPLQEIPRFRDFERARLRAARTAARVAHVNMVLGRPAPAPVGRARDVALRAVLGTPLRHRLARTFTMGWA